jgi:hypothetical protein
MTAPERLDQHCGAAGLAHKSRLVIVSLCRYSRDTGKPFSKKSTFDAIKKNISYIYHFQIVNNFPLQRDLP